LSVIVNNCSRLVLTYHRKWHWSQCLCESNNLDYWHSGLAWGLTFHSIIQK